MANVLQLIGSFNQGGSERQAVQLTRLLVKDGTHCVFVAALNADGVLRSEVEDLGFHIIPEFPLTSFYDLNFFKQLWKFRKFAKENEIDIVQTSDFYTNVFGLLGGFVAGIPIRIGAKRETYGTRSKFQLRVERFAFWFAKRIVANAEQVKRFLVGLRVPEKKISVIYNGLDVDRLKPKETDRAKICEMLAVPADENIRFVTLVANLRHAVKNQPMFLRAAATVAKKIPYAHFIIAGEGELQPQLEESARKYGIADRVHFIGRCAHVSELLSLSYACTLTSFSEGFSNSIIEYMVAGRPAVVTNVGGAAEAISDGVTGFLVESDDDKKLAERLIELLESPELAENIGRAATEKARASFSLERQLQANLEMYKDLARG